MIILATTLLFLLFVGLVRRYRWLIFGHPGFIFVMAWLMALISYYLTVWAGVNLVYNAANLDILLTFVVITTAGFLFALLFLGRTKTRVSKAKAFVSSLGDDHLLLALFGVVSLLGAITNWAILGADLNIESRREAWLSGIPVITARLWYLYILSYPAAIAAGWRIAKYSFMRHKINKTDILYLSSPLLAGLFWLLGTGGRQAFGIILMYYGCGLLLGICGLSKAQIPIPVRSALRLLRNVLIIFFAFAYIINFTGRIRAEYQRGDNYVSPWPAPLAPFGQFIEYMGTSVATFQLKANPQQKSFSPEAGKETFGILSYFRLSGFLGWTTYSSREELLYAGYEATKGELLAFSTTSVYNEILLDFGLFGGYIVCFILAVISCLVFNSWLHAPRRKLLLGHVPICITLMFWGYSHQFSILKYDVLKWMLISFAVWDIAMLILTRQRIRIPFMGKAVKDYSRSANITKSP